MPEALPTMDDGLCTVCGLSQDLTFGRNAIRIVAESPSMQQVLRRVARIAPTDAGVLLAGESGTGKEVVARAIHDASARATKRFVAINCAALPPDLLESELFGHARGAFSGAAGARRGLFEEAHGGTLFLDEIGELPAGLQAKLLRALQEGEVRRVGENESVLVDVRIIAATNCNLPELVAKKQFREDLYYRLKVFSLELPPLRERREDVLPLARAFLATEREGLRFSAEAEVALAAWPWPGNVRELRNAVRHGAVLAEGALVMPGDLPPEVAAGAAHAPPPPPQREAAIDPLWIGAGRPEDRPAPPPVQTIALPQPVLVPQQQQRSQHHLDAFEPTAPLDDVVRAHVRAAVDACDGNRAAAARLLGVGRNTLWRWLKGGRGACNRTGRQD